MRIGVLGLGKLGLPLACVYAHAGHEVHAWDVSDTVRAMVHARDTRYPEPMVADMLKTTNTLHITHPATIGDICDTVFVIVPTPSTPTGDFSDEHVRFAIGSLLYGSDPKPMDVVIVSTLSPGTSEKIAADLPQGMRLVYAPTFIALGSVVHNITKPHVQLIGTPDHQAATNVIDTISTVAPDATYRHMSFVSAELAKISFNAFITMKITFSNIMGQVCDTYEGADVDDVLGIIGLDPRVGSPLGFDAGGSYGGPCFPRDNRAFARAAGTVDTLAMLVHDLNDRHVRYIADLAHTSGEYTFTVLGLSYKEGADFRIESFGDRLATLLAQHDNARELSDPSTADVVIIAMPLRSDVLRGKINPNAKVIDVWRAHGYLKNEVREYIAFGRP